MSSSRPVHNPDIFIIIPSFLHLFYVARFNKIPTCLSRSLCVLGANILVILNLFPFYQSIKRDFVMDRIFLSFLFVLIMVSRGRVQTRSGGTTVIVVFPYVFEPVAKIAIELMKTHGIVMMIWI